jgi:hypothetical protein
MNGRTKTGLKVQTASKTEVREAGFRPSPPIKEEDQTQSVRKGWRLSQWDKVIISISIQSLGRFWQEPEPSQATGMALARCILGKFLGVVCRCFPLAQGYCSLSSRKY